MGVTDTSTNEWYFCLRHQTVEREGEGCANDHRMGPYPSREAAENWKETVDARNEEWDAEDRAWEGDG